MRSSASLTYRHRAGVRLYTSSCELAESCVFDKQSLEPILCGSPLRGSTPCTEGTGSFCRVPSRGFSRTPSDTRLAHLCRIAVRAGKSSPAGFSWPHFPWTSRSNAVGLAARRSNAPIQAGAASSPRSPFPRGWRNINRLSIGYAFGPRLRSRLTLGGLTFPRKPCAFGGRASHPSCRYSFRHTHSRPLHGSLPVPLRCGLDALLPCVATSATAARRLSPRHFRRGTARPVSCYALLKWWLLLSQHPGCHRDPTSFTTERRFGGLGRRSGFFPS